MAEFPGLSVEPEGFSHHVSMAETGHLHPRKWLMSGACIVVDNDQRALGCAQVCICASNTIGIKAGSVLCVVGCRVLRVS